VIIVAALEARLTRKQEGKPPPEGLDYRDLPPLVCRGCGQSVARGVVPDTTSTGPFAVKCVRKGCGVWNYV
jgi:hypothetical protein